MRDKERYEHLRDIAAAEGDHERVKRYTRWLYPDKTDADLFTAPAQDENANTPAPSSAESPKPTTAGDPLAP